MKSRSMQMSESLAVGLLLACVGGFLEPYSYLTRNGVFANCQTGNMVLMVMQLCKGDFWRTISYFIPILSFSLGVLLTELVRRVSDNRRLHWRQYIILLEVFLLAAAGLMPGGRYDIVATTLIAFSCSMQVESFRKVKGSVFATTMCTGNLRSGTYEFFTYLTDRDAGSLRRAGHYFSVILVFMAGAAIGSFAAELLGKAAVFIACALLLSVFLIMFIHPDTGTELTV